jgi:hypothetical protein
MRWDAFRNGDLIKVAELTGFDAMLTADRSIAYQQNNAIRTLSLVVVSTNYRPLLMSHGDTIRAALSRAYPGSFETVPIGQGRGPRSRLE